MPRPPDGATPRESTFTMRVTEEDRARITRNRVLHGDQTNSTYIRRLVEEDERKLLMRSNRRELAS